jgi:calcineurin-like phosphoesterase family protein
MTMYLTSDWHLFHFNVIEYCNRPYKDVNQMHKDMQFEHNQVISDKDDVWNLGDITMLSSEYVGKVKKEILKFNGTKHLVIGNHDEWRPSSYEKAGFWTIHTAFWFQYKGFTFYLVHDPAKYTIIENDPKAIMLCGHVHNLFKHLLPEKRVINVGVDVWKRPVSFKEIIELLEKYDIVDPGFLDSGGLLPYLDIG